ALLRAHGPALGAHPPRLLPRRRVVERRLPSLRQDRADDVRGKPRDRAHPRAAGPLRLLPAARAPRGVRRGAEGARGEEPLARSRLRGRDPRPVTRGVAGMPVAVVTVTERGGRDAVDSEVEVRTLEELYAACRDAPPSKVMRIVLKGAD